MQTREFDKLFLEAPFDAKAAFLPENNKQQKRLLKDKKQLKVYVEENEVRIPDQLNSEIQTLIDHRRKLGDSEANIRRLVKKIFHITII